MKTSDSSPSRYWGRPLSVLRVMDGRERLQPKPNGPLPAPESYESASCGPKPDLPGLVAIGTDMEPVPVTGFTANFSPMPRMAPPPFGKGDTRSGKRRALLRRLRIGFPFLPTRFVHEAPAAEDFLDNLRSRDRSIALVGSVTNLSWMPAATDCYTEDGALGPRA